MIPIQFITNSTEKYSFEEGARLALEGGCKWIQLRMKDAAEDEKESVARKLLPLCRKNKAVLIIDDDVEFTKKVEADGVHLGKKDMPVDKAREILGQGYIIGATANVFEDIVIAKKSGADYVGLGPFRFTTTKKGLSPIIGLDGYKEIMRKMKDADINIPICAIGGITIEDVPEIMHTGVNGIALSGAILRADNPADEMKAFLNITI